MKNWAKILTLSLVGLVSACGSDAVEEEIPVLPDNPQQKIELTSRVVNSSFENGDAIGVYVTNWVNGSSSELAAANNYANNVKFVVNNAAWTPVKPIYWKDANTTSDFYGYYPYATVENALAYKFQVKEAQNQKNNYKASDFLWGKKVGETPSKVRVDMMLDHMMSKAVVKIVAGEGFAESELDAAKISVVLANVKNNAVINLSNGAVKEEGDVVNISAYQVNNRTFEALVVPQHIDKTDLVIVNFNGNEYKLNRAMDFESRKQYTFTITLSKTSSGINVGIGSWDVVDSDFGGTVN